MSLAIQGVNLFPEWAISTQDETLSFTAIVHYNINSFHLLKVYFDQTVCTVSQARGVRTHIPYSADEDTEAPMNIVVHVMEAT